MKRVKIVPSTTIRQEVCHFLYDEVDRKLCVDVFGRSGRIWHLILGKMCGQ